MQMRRLDDGQKQKRERWRLLFKDIINLILEKHSTMTQVRDRFIAAESIVAITRHQGCAFLFF